LKSAKGSYAIIIKRLKADLELSIIEANSCLQGEVEKMRGENQTLAMTVNKEIL
jgi:hypothetical protein